MTGPDPSGGGSNRWDPGTDAEPGSWTPDRGVDPALEDSAEGTVADWPVELTGVTESLVTTLGPNDRWNVAPLGLVADDPVTATTWGRTRTRRNFERTGSGYVQFPTDPVLFVEAALSIVEVSEPVLADATAWTRVAVRRLDSGVDGGTEWVRWALEPVDSEIVSRRVPTLSRARGAILEASVAASRLDVDGYDTQTGRAVLARASETVERTGGPRERDAFDRLLDHLDRDLPEG